MHVIRRCYVTLWSGWALHAGSPTRPLTVKPSPHCQVYRAATTLVDYRVTFHDIILTPEKACVWVDLKVRVEWAAWHSMA